MNVVPEAGRAKVDSWPLLAAVILAIAAIAASVAGSYGSNWDEAIQARYGVSALDYFRTAGADDSCNRLLDLRWYSPAVEMLLALASGGLHAGTWAVRHLLLPVFGLGALALVAAFGRRLGRPLVPLFAIFALVTMPRFSGDWFANSKDVPFACAVAGVFVALEAWLRRERPGPGATLLLGGALGAVAIVRPGGFPLLLVWVAAGVCVAAVLLPRGVRSTLSLRRAASAGVSFVAAWILMVLPWPFAHGSPLFRPIEAMRVAASFTSVYPVLWNGTAVPSDAIPRTYLPWFLLITTPPIHLAFAAGGAFVALHRLRRRAADGLETALILMWLLVPVAAFVVLRPNVYDGVRHFLFLLPAVALLSALGAAALSQAVPGRFRTVAAVAIGALFLLPVKDLVSLHPYQTTYFNGIVGGVRGADGRYDTDYWLSSYRDAIEQVGRLAGPDRPVGVLVAGDFYIAPWLSAYAAPNLRISLAEKRPAGDTLPEGFEYYVATRRFGFDAAFPASPIVATVGRDGAVFTVIRGVTRRATTGVSGPANTSIRNPGTSPP
jgi:hypothetical protein